MSQPLDSPARPSRRAQYGWAAAGVLGVLVVVATFFSLGGPTGGRSASGGPGETAAAVLPASDQLPLSSTYTTVDGAPTDTAVNSGTDGVVVHPLRETPVFDRPGGSAIARMPTTQFGDTWLPVIDERDGEWVLVLLPSKPSGSTGWLRSLDVERAASPYEIRVHLDAKRLDLVEDGRVARSWTVGTGKPSAPTPTGRTFLLGAFSDRQQAFSPVILPLGTHNPTHDTFGGGPGTVAIHTWPTADVFGTATSDGCIRVPADALEKLTEVPLGTLVIVDEE